MITSLNLRTLDCGHLTDGVTFSTPGGPTFCTDCARDKSKAQVIEAGEWTSQWNDESEMFGWMAISFPATDVRERQLKSGATRIQFWFVGPDGHTWYGFRDWFRDDDDSHPNGDAFARRTVTKAT